MSWFFDSNDQFVEIVKNSNAQLFISGGHGGLVTYDGNGGPMKKEGGPMDRLVLLMGDGQLLGDAGLDVEYGYINFSTGNLIEEEVRFTDDDVERRCIHFAFAENTDGGAFEVRGGISTLGIGIHECLASGPVEKSFMVWRFGDNTGEASLPYAAWHKNIWVNDKILDWFKLSNANIVGAETSWCKKPPIEPTPDGAFDSKSVYGLSFRTQQHLGHLRVFLEVG